MNKKPLIWTIVVVAAVLLGAMGGGVIGYMLGKKKDSDDPSTVTITVVCNETIQEKFANEYSMTFRDHSRLQSIYEDVISREQWEKDPNCLLISLLYTTLADSADKTAAQQAFDNIKQLSRQGLNPSSEFIVASWQTMQILINNIQ